MLTILTGESGCGKSTIEKKLEEKGFYRIISYTTRDPRAGEINNVTYHYIKKLKFLLLYFLKFFGEYTKYNGKYYGAAKRDLKVAYSVGVFEPVGLRQIKKQKFKNISFYIMVSEDERRKRMLQRGDSINNIEKRIQNDKVAFQNIKEETDYIIVNKDLDETVDRIIAIIKEIEEIAA